MSRSHPPSRALEPAGDRKVQQFLERAAPVVLESRVLNLESWGQLLALAEELELSEAQLRATIDDLQARGVIEKTDLGLPKPPPLPAVTPKPNGPPESAVRPAPPSAEAEDVFSLTPPAPPPRTASETEQLTEVERLKRFVDQARMIIGEQRGMGPKAQSLITATGEELGLSDRQMQEALKEVVHEPRPEPTEEASRSSRWRIEGQPVPEPPAPQKKPSETYREFVGKSFDKFVNEGAVSKDLEEGILKHGTKVLRLSQVYAQHLIQEVAQNRKLRMESSEPQEEQPLQTPGERDPLLARFAERAAPILAQHRGLNAKSRVLLAAVANEIGLSEDQMENAIATLQQEDATGAVVDAIQQERLELFRIFLRNSMQRLPRGLLTPNVEAALIESGENLHGVAAELVRPTIRGVADELQLSVISAAQAEEHIEQLVERKLGDDFVLKADVRERIRFEGEQWGMTAVQVDSIIRTKTQSNYRRRRSEQSFTNLALLAAGIAVLLVVCFLAWAMFGGQLAPSRPPVSPSDDQPEVALSPPPPPSADRDDSWWDDDLSIAAANARLEFPALRGKINEIASDDPARRRAAYQVVVDHFLHRTTSDLHRRIFLELLSRCYALDPDGTAAEVIAAALLADVPGPEDRLNPEAQLYPKIFWAVRTAVAALAEESISAERFDRLSIPLSRLLGTSLAHQTGRRELQRDCLGALAERLYRRLIAAVDAPPDVVESLQSVITKEVARYLDRATLDKLNAEFLAGVLAATPGEWQRYEALMYATSRSPDPLAIVRLVDLFESTPEAELQRYLGALLMQAADVVPRSLTVAEIAAEVRRSVGVTSDTNGGGRWLKFSRASSQELTKPRSAAVDVSTLLGEVVRLARLSTLGCALAQQESGNRMFDELFDRPEGAKVVERTVDGAAALRRELVPSERRQLEIALRALTDERAEDSIAYRASRVEFLAGLAERVAFLAPGHARQLARYLLKKKGDNEHQLVMKHIDALGLWVHVRLTVADQLERATISTRQRNELVAALAQQGTVEDSTAAQRVALLRSVRGELANRAPTAGRQPFDLGLHELLNLYRTQADLLGVPPANHAEAARPSVVLRAIIEHRSESIDPRSLAEEAATELASVRFQLRAIEYLATDDLRRTIMLERLWLQLLSVEARSKNLRTAREARALVQTLSDSERPASEMNTEDSSAGSSNPLSLVVQLRDGQAALLRMWTLLNKPG